MAETAPGRPGSSPASAKPSLMWRSPGTGEAGQWSGPYIACCVQVAPSLGLAARGGGGGDAIHIRDYSLQRKHKVSSGQEDEIGLLRQGKGDPPWGKIKQFRGEEDKTMGCFVPLPASFLADETYPSYFWNLEQTAS